jgi:hypothetical protein
MRTVNLIFSVTVAVSVTEVFAAALIPMRRYMKRLFEFEINLVRTPQACSPGN